jgi:FKBP-type peptidyl-prolyl cis-trans isomerase SlyD
MKITDKSMVAIEYSLTLDNGEEIDKSEPGKPLEFIFNTGQIIPGLEKEIEGMEVGDNTKFSVEPEDGYGEAKEELRRKIPRKEFPDDIKVGMAFQASGPQGAIPFIIKKVEDDEVTIDLNHPLCGERLHFDVKLVGVREATDEEMAEAASSAECGHASCAGCNEHSH